MALANGEVDVACASITSFEKAVQSGSLDPERIAILAKSEPIPYPPLAMHTRLAPELKVLLREAFGRVHEQPGIRPGMIRGYGGKVIDRYDARFPEQGFDAVRTTLASVTPEVKNALLRKAATR
jgi:phosphonate transport system substrate-binding protein